MASAMLGSLTGNDGDSYYNSLDWDTGSDNAEDVPSYKIDTSQDYGGVGYTPYQQSYTTENKPSWMQGIWDMPEWGYDVSGNALTQSDLQPASQSSSGSSGNTGQASSGNNSGYTTSGDYQYYLDLMNQQRTAEGKPVVSTTGTGGTK